MAAKIEIVVYPERLDKQVLDCVTSKKGKLTWMQAILQYLFGRYVVGDEFRIGEFRNEFLPLILRDVGESRRLTPEKTFSRYMTEDLCKKYGYIKRITPQHELRYGHYRVISLPDFNIFAGGRKKSIGEALVSKALEALGIVDFCDEKKFDDLRNPETGHQLRIDFYVYMYDPRNYAVEFDGPQHSHAVEHYGGEAAFQDRQRLDKIKNRYCKKKGIKMIRLTEPIYWKIVEALHQEIIIDYESEPEAWIGSLFD
jgi:hypothetical protein